VLFRLFCEVEFGNRFVEGSIEAKGIFEILDKVFDEIFSILYLLFIECLKSCVNAISLFLTDTSDLDIEFQLI
jgi:hypothetical protein